METVIRATVVESITCDDCYVREEIEVKAKFVLETDKTDCVAVCENCSYSYDWTEKTVIVEN